MFGVDAWSSRCILLRSDCPKNRVRATSVGAIESLDDFELIDVMMYGT